VIDADGRRLLLAIARTSIAAHVHGLRCDDPDVPGALARPGGAFVTIRRRGHLRGCIGRIQSDQPLARVVSRVAAAACSADPRFPAVTPEQFEEIDIEISVLGALEPIDSPHEVAIGRHGLVVERGVRRGLLLPQVAVEYGWDAPTFLRQTCVKAGLEAEAWKANVRIWRFEAEVFGERQDPKC
jgi:AmmeMemoRadiSam system protein A